MAKNNLQHKTSELVCRNPKINTFIDSYIFTGENHLEQKLGQVYVVIETEDGSIESAEVSQGVIEIVKNTYYKEVGLNAEKNFEQTIIRLNEILSDLLVAGKNQWLGKMNAIVAVIQGDKIVLTQTGKAQAILIRGQEITAITEDLVSQDQTQAPQIFPNLLTGQLEPGDIILMGTPALFGYFPDQQLADTLINKKLDPKLAKQELLRQIKFNSISKNIATIIATTHLAKTKVKLSNKKTIEQNKTEPVDISLTREHLQNAVDRRLSARKKHNPAYLVLSWLTTAFKLGFVFTLNFLKFAKNKIAPQLAKLLGTILTVLITIGAKLHPKITKSSSDTSEQITISGYKTKTNFGLSGLASKALASFPKIWQLPKPALAGAGLTLVIILSLIIIHPFGNNKAPETDFATLLARAQEKEKTATQNLVFKKDEEARALFEEAKKLNQQVLGAQDYKEQAKTLQARIDEGLNVLAKRNEPNNLTTLVKLSDFTTNSEAVGLILNDSNKLLAWSGLTNNIWQILVNKKSEEPLQPSFQNIGHLQAGDLADNDGNLVFINTDNEIIFYNKSDNKLEKLPDLKNQSLVSLTIYQSKLYTISKKQILKYTRTLTGFSKPSDWLTNGNDIEAPVDLAIDGFVYVLEDSGQIKKFLSGDKQEFAVANLKKDLSGATKIVTSANLNNIYILDPANKRIVVLDKKGQLVDQYSSSQFNNLQDLAISDDEKKGFVLNGNQVISFNL